MTKSKKKTKRSEMVKKTEFSLSAPQAQRGYPSPGISINGIRLHTLYNRIPRGLGEFHLI